MKKLLLSLTFFVIASPMLAMESNNKQPDDTKQQSNSIYWPQDILLLIIRETIESGNLENISNLSQVNTIFYTLVKQACEDILKDNKDCAGLLANLKKGYSAQEVLRFICLMKPIDEMTPLCLLIKKLISVGANINHIYGGYTVLSFVTTMKNTNTVKALIKVGADVDVVVSGAPSLWIAVFSGQTEIVKLLLDAGANPNSVGWKGDTLINTVKEEGANPEIIQLLEQAVEKQNDQNNNNYA